MVRGLSKRFGATVALDRVDLTLAMGDVHALVGENGAGKSTLIKILAGVYAADAGEVALDGKPFAPASPAAAQRAGVVLIPQELRLVPAMTVAENVLLGAWPTRRLGGVLPAVAEGRLNREAAALLAQLGLEIDPRQPAGSLPFAERQLIVIARALHHRAHCLILDEPTASLESREVERLFTLVRRLAASGTAVVYISHRLDEIDRLAGRVTVMRDGRVVATYERDGFTIPTLVRDMTGRDLGRGAHAGPVAAGEPFLRATVAAGGPSPEPFALDRRQVVGLAGLLGSGAAEALQRLFGARGPQAAEMAGGPVVLATPRQAIDAGIGYVPSERFLGIIPSLTVWENIALPHFALLRQRRRLGWGAIRRLAAELAQRLDIRPSDPDRPAGSLSGGNQQKVLFARWLMGGMEALLLDEPTHGIDVGAKATIDGLIRRFAEEGGAVMLASSEFHELLALADSVVTMRRGAVTGRLVRGDGDYSEQALRDRLGG